MSYSSQRVVSDGTLDILAISIEYFERTEIAVLFDGIVTTTGWSWVGTTDKTISFSPDVPNGVEVMVLRTSDLSNIRHEFSQGAAFKAANIDEDFRQILHIAQEARENASISDMYQNLNMHGYKVTNVGVGTGPLDSVNQTQLTANNAVVQGYATAAQASADAAHASELAAATSASEAAGVVTAAIGVTVQGYNVDTPTVAASQAEMEAGSEVALRSMSPLRVAQAISALVPPSAAFPTGTAMLFAQASAPTGWTKQTTHNDKALRVVSGTSGGSAAGSVAFSTVFGRTATDASSLSIAQLAAHTHTVPGLSSSGGSSSGISENATQFNGSPIATSSMGSGSTHTHGIDLRVQYVDVIIATKN